jgi:hypothetical protein
MIFPHEKELSACGSALHQRTRLLHRTAAMAEGRARVPLQ